jgi:hypothetical protein
MATLEADHEPRRSAHEVLVAGQMHVVVAYRLEDQVGVIEGSLGETCRAPVDRTTNPLPVDRTTGLQSEAHRFRTDPSRSAANSGESKRSSDQLASCPSNT